MAHGQVGSFNKKEQQMKMQQHQKWKPVGKQQRGRGRERTASG